MSFVTSIRDYIDTLNLISDSLSHDWTMATLIQETGIYILKTLQTGLLYLVSFQWIRDFTLLPIVLPQVSASIFQEIFVLEKPSQVVFDFLEIPNLHQNKFLIGFFNSLFLCLPFSAIHMIAARRFLLLGTSSAVYTIGGYLSGQIFFVMCVLFGLRSLLIPWLTFEPVPYILGLLLLFRMSYEMMEDKYYRLRGWFGPKFFYFFFMSFALAWCEQTTLFQYLGNLTLSAHVTNIESFSSTNPLSTFVNHFFYILGLSIGSVVFTSLWGPVLFRIKNYVPPVRPKFSWRYRVVLHKVTATLTLIFCIISLPFYSVDVLLAGPLGFVPRDLVFATTPLAEQRLIDLQPVHLLAGPESDYKFLNVDVAKYDRGIYLPFPGGIQGPSFEELHYRGEFAWYNRDDKHNNLIDPKKAAFTLKKLFRKRLEEIEKEKKEKRTRDFFDIDPSFNEPIVFFDVPYVFEENEIDFKSPRIRRFLEHNTSRHMITENRELFLPYIEVARKTFPHDNVINESVYMRDMEPSIKYKYYTNPVYKLLLALDIDLFLNRQPHTSKLNVSQEDDLDDKRRALESYYNSLRDYAELPYSEQFETYFDGAKSFSNQMYNQQFKGTLRSLRRLFSLTLNNETNQTVLKFDQPLYQTKNSFSPYHEELSAAGLEDQTQNLDSLPRPFYAGWDEQKRKFVITNKILPRTLAGYKVNVESTTQKLFTQDSQKQPTKVKFTAWPLSYDTVSLEKKKESPIPYVILFQPVRKKTLDLLQTKEFETLPSNLIRYEIAKKVDRDLTLQRGKLTERTLIREPQWNYALQFKPLAPRRGGFLWPGHRAFDFSFVEDFYKEVSKKISEKLPQNLKRSSPPTSPK